MTTTTRPTELPTRSMISRVASLARGELRMLLRNTTAITNVVLVPLIMLGALASLGEFEGAQTSFGTSIMVTGVVIAIAYVVYYNLVSTYTARRESYVLKRMRTGPVSDAGVIAATSIPSVVLALLQIAVVLAALVAFGKAPGLTNIVPVLVAIVFGMSAFAGIALISTTFTRTAETAQITTLPVVMVTMALSGMFFPLSILPDAVATMAHLTPGAAIVELLNLGLAGIDRSGASVTGVEAWTSMLPPTLVLVAWTVIGYSHLRRQFRWEPRR